MADLSKMHPAELRAAMTGGTKEWGQRASAMDHVRYSQPTSPKSRRRCLCGCKRRATHLGMANGIALAFGCEFFVARWVKRGLADLTARRAV
jgi:hypothetical protein